MGDVQHSDMSSFDIIPPMILKIVSGAQTGVDRGALDAAIEASCPYGGWIPKGRRSEDGGVPDRYTALIESPSTNYLKPKFVSSEFRINE